MCPKSNKIDIETTDRRSAATPVRSARPNCRPRGVGLHCDSVACPTPNACTDRASRNHGTWAQTALTRIATSVILDSLGKRRQRTYRRPICTSAPVLKPRWSQDRGRCEPPRNTRSVWPPATHLIEHSRAHATFSLCAGNGEAQNARKQVFESPRKIARARGAVTNHNMLQKNIYKSFKREPSDRIFQTPRRAMGISD